MKEVTEINDADFIELVSGKTSDYTVGNIYEVKIDDGSIFGIEGERYTLDNTYVPSCEFFYNAKLQLKFYQKVSE